MRMAIVAHYDDISDAFVALLRRSEDSHLQAVLADLLHNVPIEVVQVAQRALPSLHGQPPSHTCEAWRWALTAGTVLTVSSVQPLLVPNGILLTAALDIATPQGV